MVVPALQHSPAMSSLSADRSSTSRFFGPIVFHSFRIALIITPAGTHLFIVICIDRPYAIQSPFAVTASASGCSAAAAYALRA